MWGRSLLDTNSPQVGNRRPEFWNQFLIISALLLLSLLYHHRFFSYFLWDYFVVFFFFFFTIFVRWKYTVLIIDLSYFLICAF